MLVLLLPLLNSEGLQLKALAVELLEKLLYRKPSADCWIGKVKVFGEL
jgi:hypothetical protein